MGVGGAMVKAGIFGLASKSLQDNHKNDLFPITCEPWVGAWRFSAMYQLSAESIHDINIMYGILISNSLQGNALVVSTYPQKRPQLSVRGSPISMFTHESKFVCHNNVRHISMFTLGEEKQLLAT